MKNKMKALSMAVLMGAGLFFTSCEDTENIIDDGTTQYDGKLTMEELPEQAVGNTEVLVYASDITADNIKVLVSLTSTSTNMDRVYVTRNVAGMGAEPYKWEGSGIDTNGDGSVNLTDGKSFTQEFVIPKNTDNAFAGTEEYKLWATDGKGDYRDSSNSFLVGIGTIKVIYGSEGNNPNAAVKHFQTTILAAPLANGLSKTFMSTIDGTTYQFDPASAETAKFWDLGYYWGDTGHASLASAFNYPTDIVNISNVSGIAAADLNKCYFVKSDKTVDQFNAIQTRSDLDNGAATTSSPQRINLLATTATLGNGNMIEFVDGYGKKGIIRVVDIVSGDGSDGKITLDVKVQR